MQVNIPNSKVLYIFADHWQGVSPGQRTTFELFWDSLKKRGIEPILFPLRTPEEEKILRSQGKFADKILLLLKWTVKRNYQIKGIPEGSVVMIYRHVFPLLNYFEKYLKSKKNRNILIIDEAYWWQDFSPTNRTFSFVKKIFRKYPAQLKYIDGVIVSTPYLVDLVYPYVKNVVWIPCIWSSGVECMVQKKDKAPCVGISGSFTSVKFVEPIFPILEKIKKKTGARILIIGSKNLNYPEFDFKEWSLDKEIELATEIDIGLAPYPNALQSYTKSPVKINLYMALGIPCVASPVGIIPQMVIHGQTGFLAETPEEWEKYITLLIENESLRKEMGKRARKHYEEHFSFQRWEDTFVNFVAQFFD